MILHDLDARGLVPPLHAKPKGESAPGLPSGAPSFLVTGSPAPSAGPRPGWHRDPREDAAPTCCAALLRGEHGAADVIPALQAARQRAHARGVAHFWVGL